MTPSSIPPGTPDKQDEIPSNALGSAPDINESDISPEELKILDTAGTEESRDDENLQRSTLDSTDEDGVPLNETDDLAGDDLDVPGSEIDDQDEMIGEEDEENNSFSMPDQEDTEDPEV